MGRMKQVNHGSYNVYESPDKAKRLLKKMAPFAVVLALSVFITKGVVEKDIEKAVSSADADATGEYFVSGVYQSEQFLSNNDEIAEIVKQDILSEMDSTTLGTYTLSDEDVQRIVSEVMEQMDSTQGLNPAQLAEVQDLLTLYLENINMGYGGDEISETLKQYIATQISLAVTEEFTNTYGETITSALTQEDLDLLRSEMKQYVNDNLTGAGGTINIDEKNIEEIKKLLNLEEMVQNILNEGDITIGGSLTESDIRELVNKYISESIAGGLTLNDEQKQLIIDAAVNSITSNVENLWAELEIINEEIVTIQELLDGVNGAEGILAKLETLENTVNNFNLNDIVTNEQMITEIKNQLANVAAGFVDLSKALATNYQESVTYNAGDYYLKGETLYKVAVNGMELPTTFADEFLNLENIVDSFESKINYSNELVDVLQEDVIEMNTNVINYNKDMTEKMSDMESSLQTEMSDMKTDIQTNITNLVNTDVWLQDLVLSASGFVSNNVNGKTYYTYTITNTDLHEYSDVVIGYADTTIKVAGYEQGEGYLKIHLKTAPSSDVVIKTFHIQNKMTE